MTSSFGGADEKQIAKLVSQSDSLWKQAEDWMGLFHAVGVGEAKLPPDSIHIPLMACMIFGELVTRQEQRKKDEL